MRCRRAQQAMLERELGLASPEAERALARHLARCAPCADRQLAAGRLSAGLTSSRIDLPFEIDVVPALLPRLAALPPIDREEVPVRQLGWAAAAGFACALLLLACVVPLFPELSGIARGGWLLGRALLAAAGDLARPMVSLLSLPFRLLASLQGLAATVATLAGRLEPLGAGAVALGYAAMALTIVIAVGRDLKAPALPNQRGNRP